MFKCVLQLQKDWIDLLPTISIGWEPFRLYIGWLMFNISIT